MSGPINLSKGQRIDLTKTNPGLKKITIGLGWDINKYNSGQDYDLDASAFGLLANGRARGLEDFLFYNNKSLYNGAVAHTGDNRTGAGHGDDEQIAVDFSRIPNEVERIGITVTIHDAAARDQNFGHISNAFVRIEDEEAKRELLRYDLGETFSLETAIVICELYRHGSDWRFQAVGSGFQGGLEALCRNYGLDAS